MEILNLPKTLRSYRSLSEATRGALGVGFSTIITGGLPLALPETNSKSTWKDGRPQKGKDSWNQQSKFRGYASGRVMKIPK